MKKLALLPFILILLLSLVPLTQVHAAPDFERIAGTNRLETAIEVSKKGWPNGLDNTDKSVILARSDNPADALSAASLAGAKDAPILLTAPGHISNIVLEEMDRLGTEKVYVLGGKGAIQGEVVKTLNKHNYSTKRVHGTNRFETAAAINKEAGTSQSNRAIIANGNTMADALSASGEAAVNGVPIYLTKENKLPVSLPDTIKKVYIYGGPGVVSTQVEQNLKSDGFYVQRIAGPDRYITNLSVLYAQDYKADTFLLVRGTSANNDKQDYPDAVVASGLAKRLNAKVLLSDPQVKKDSLTFYMESHNAKTYVLGGPGAIAQHVSDFYQSIEGTEPDSGNVTYSSNQVDDSNLPTNENMKKVKDLYKQELDLKVLPLTESGFKVFEGDFSNFYDADHRLFFGSIDPSYDDIAVKAMKLLGLSLSKAEIQQGLDEARSSSQRVKIGETVFTAEANNVQVGFDGYNFSNYLEKESINSLLKK